MKSLLTGNKSRNKHVFWSMVRWSRGWQSKTQKKDKHIGLVHDLNEKLDLTLWHSHPRGAFFSLFVISTEILSYATYAPHRSECISLSLKHLWCGQQLISEMAANWINLVPIHRESLDLACASLHRSHPYTGQTRKFGKLSTLELVSIWPQFHRF